MKKFILDNIKILQKSSWYFVLTIIVLSIFVKDYKISIDNFVLGVIATLIIRDISFYINSKLYINDIKEQVDSLEETVKAYEKLIDSQRKLLESQNR